MVSLGGESVPGSSNRLIADRYRLETSIGRGAMGTVWLATDELLQRRVAVKELKLSAGLPDAEAAELRERALREARAMAVVTHPNVVTLYDVARDNDTPFVVMELVESQSLAKLLSEHGHLNRYLLAMVIDGVAAALLAAHRIGIVHRDVKPGNVLVGERSEVKLGDFGIARNGADTTITHSGIVLGTPAFVAPEVAVGDPVDTRSDLWSLGATLFTAAEGRAPYDGSTDPLITISSIINGKVPRHRQTGPIGEVISGLMVKDPASRMSLKDVRRLVRPLVPEAGNDPFERLLDNGSSRKESTRQVEQGSMASTPSRAPAPNDAQRRVDPDAPTPEINQVKPHRTSRLPMVLTCVGIALVLILLGVAGGLLLSRDAKLTPARGIPFDSGSGMPQSEATGGFVGAQGAFTEIEAEKFANASSEISLGRGENGSIRNIYSEDQVLYQDIEFGSSTAHEFAARLASQIGSGTKAKIEIRLDSPDAQPIGKLAVTSSNGWENWKEVPIVVEPTTGTHDVYLKFFSDQPGEIVNLDWFQFYK